MRGSDELTANLKVTVVSRRMNDSWRRFSRLRYFTENVLNVILQMKNYTVSHTTATGY